jgi:hypothetical protein
MPKLTRWMLKTSLVYLVLALGTAGALAAARSGWLPTSLNALSPVYFHLFLVGWVTQLIFGVVFWMFPKYSPDKPRGSEVLGWWTYILLNTGLLLRCLGEPLLSWGPAAFWGWIVALSALLQWAGGMCFVFNTWGRVKEK